jgi:hypothetical protein
MPGVGFPCETGETGGKGFRWVGRLWEEAIAKNPLASFRHFEGGTKTRLTACFKYVYTTVPLYSLLYMEGR